MEIFVVDDTNVTKNERFEFLIYGGLVVDGETAKSLGVALSKLKSKYGIEKDRPVKWSNTKWRGVQLDEKQFADFKGAVLEVVGQSSAKIILSLMPQGFYHVVKSSGGPLREVIDEAKRKKEQGYAVNLSLEKFNFYLLEGDLYGLMMADNFPDSMREYMAQHCQTLFPSGTNRSALDRVVSPVVTVNNEHSPIHQINDIVLGAVAHSLMELSHNFLPIIGDNFWCADPQDRRSILGRGFSTYPAVPYSPRLKQSLEEVREKFIRRLG